MSYFVSLLILNIFCSICAMIIWFISEWKNSRLPNNSCKLVDTDYLVGATTGEQLRLHGRDNLQHFFSQNFFGMSDNQRVTAFMLHRREDKTLPIHCFCCYFSTASNYGKRLTDFSIIWQNYTRENRKDCNIHHIVIVAV